jgi:SulP family sulfate permease
MHHKEQSGPGSVSLRRGISFSASGFLAGFSRKTLGTDILAGLALSAIVVPQSMAYAEIAGLPPQAGVFVSFAAPLAYALLGSSRQLICGPSSATAAISAAHIASLAAGSPAEFATMSAALAVLSGVIFVVLGVLRLGFTAQYISAPVQIGFLFGLGLTIITGQLFTMLGVDAGHGPFIHLVPDLLSNLTHGNPWTLAIGVITLVLMVLLGRLMPVFPSALVLVAASIVISTVLDLPARGVGVIGHIDRTVPTFAIPTVSLDTWMALLPGALAVVFIGSSESITIARRYADKYRYEIKPDREFLAVGVSGIASGLFHGFVTSGGASQSAANDRAGAKSQVSSLVVSAMALLAATLLLPYIANMPHAVLAAIVVNAVRGFISVPDMREIWQIDRTSFGIAMIALVGVLVFGILTGLVLAVGVAIFGLLIRFSRPGVTVLQHARATEPAAQAAGSGAHPGLVALRPESAILFINSDWIRTEVQARIHAGQEEVIALDLEESPDLGYAGIKAIRSLREAAREAGKELWLTNVHATVEAALRQAALVHDDEPAWVFASHQTALDTFHQRHEPATSAPQGSSQAAIS